LAGAVFFFMAYVLMENLIYIKLTTNLQGG